MTYAVVLFLLAQVTSIAYIKFRFGRRFTLTSMLLGMLVLVHGLPMLLYLYVRGPDTFIFERITSRVDIAAVESSLLIALAAMYISIIAGSEVARTYFSRWHLSGMAALQRDPNAPPIRTYKFNTFSKGIVWLVTLSMLFISVYESQPSKIYSYFASGGLELEKIDMRREAGGSSVYIYNLVLYGIAPFLLLVTYFADSSNQRTRSLRPLAATLFLAVLMGKLAMLAKAPPIIFLLQLFVAFLLLRGQRIDFRLLVLGGSMTFFLFLGIVLVTIPGIEIAEALDFLHYRIFDIPNEGLLEYFCAFPAMLPHQWGYGIVGKFIDPNFVPTYFEVANIARASLESSSNSMFIADAWAEFSWFGVIGFSFLAGLMVRGIDIYAFRHGVSDESICIIAGGAFGVFTMLSTSLTTAALSGGLLVIPFLSATFSDHQIKPSYRLGR